MRVIAGEAKGKKLQRVPGEGTRPITDRVKESLFNILRWHVPDSLFLDLFGGTGSVGIEALSRGAEKAVFIEKAPKAVRVIQANLRHTGLDEWAEVIRDDAFKFVARTNQHFDIIYIAPPQYKKLWSEMLLALDKRPLLKEDGIIVAQIFPKEFVPLPLERYHLTDQRKYGSTLLCFYEYK